MSGNWYSRENRTAGPKFNADTWCFVPTGRPSLSRLASTLPGVDLMIPTWKTYSTKSGRYVRHHELAAAITGLPDDRRLATIQAAWLALEQVNFLAVALSASTPQLLQSVYGIPDRATRVAARKTATVTGTAARLVTARARISQLGHPYRTTPTATEWDAPAFTPAQLHRWETAGRTRAQAHQWVTAGYTLPRAARLIRAGWDNPATMADAADAAGITPDELKTGPVWTPETAKVGAALQLDAIAA